MLQKRLPKKVIHKVTGGTYKFTGNKITDKIVKPKSVSDENLRGAEEMIIPLQKREKILNE